jgi:hypothetical protein
VERRHGLDTFYVVPLAAVLGDPEVLVYDRLRGRAAEAEDDARLHGLYLALQVGVARPDLPCLRLAVLHPAALLDRGPALDNVREVDLLACEIHRCKDVVEELACPPDERQPGRVLVLARALADEHQRRVRVPAREDRIRARHREVALGADGDLARELLQPFLAVLLAALRGIE